MDKKVTGYDISPTKILKDTTLIDVTEDHGAGFGSYSKEAKFFKDIVAETLSFDCESGSEGTVSMAWNCEEKRTAAYLVQIIVTSSGKTFSGVELQIGSTFGGSDIMAPYLLDGAYLDAVINVPLIGVMPTILSDSGTYFLTLVVGGSSGIECDILVKAHHEDV